MSNIARFRSIALVIIFLLSNMPAVIAQDAVTILSETEAVKVVPSGFYFEGQSGATQRRNSAAARFGTKHYVIAGLVDTAGYSTEVKAKYEGFIIADSAVSVGGSDLAVGAYGFGFSSDGKMNIFDVSGNQVVSVASHDDKDLKRPRPLQMVKGDGGVRLYNGRNYVVITAK
jgi:hypothetical protein